MAEEPMKSASRSLLRLAEESIGWLRRRGWLRRSVATSRSCEAGSFAVPAPAVVPEPPVSPAVGLLSQTDRFMPGHALTGASGPSAGLGGRVRLAEGTRSAEETRSVVSKPRLAETLSSDG